MLPYPQILPASAVFLIVAAALVDADPNCPVARGDEMMHALFDDLDDDSDDEPEPDSQATSGPPSNQESGGTDTTDA